MVEEKNVRLNMPSETLASGKTNQVYEGGLQISSLSKTYPGTKALDELNLDVGHGEIHALVGANGSGKSTLVKILAGAVTADSGGEICVDGRIHPAHRFSPSMARDVGLHFVHQEPAVFNDLTVAENLSLGRGFVVDSVGRIRWRATRHRAQQVIDRFQIDADCNTVMRNLSAADRMMVAIARALQDQDTADHGLLVLDEPTAALPAREVDTLLGALRRYSAAGQTIVYVSHRLDEVLRLADSVTVMRDGRRVAMGSVSEFNENDLIEGMAGRPVEKASSYQQQNRVDGSIVLETDRLSGGVVQDVNLRLHQGEILGIAGLLGSGRSELLRLLFGDLPMESGTITVDGQEFRPRSPDLAMKIGFAYTSENRHAEAAFPDLSVRENLSIGQVERYWNGAFLNLRRERYEARWSIKEFMIRTASEETAMSSLSGGNQQKVVLARWMRRNPRVLLLDEPTQGVDAVARAEIYALMRRAADAGAGVVVVFSDYEELALVCDRVVILDKGHIKSDVARDELNVDHLIELTYSSGGNEDANV